jgi:N-acetylglucosaminyl-diphospho-decaprenol L-rhamnosyltransferase
MKSAYIVVVNRGSIYDPASHSLAAARSSGYFTVIVENGREPLSCSANEADFVLRVENKGYGHAVNSGIREARSIHPEVSIIVFSNDDVLVPKEAFGELEKRLTRCPECVFSLASVYRDGTSYFARGSIDLRVPHLAHHPPPSLAARGEPASEAVNGAIVACAPQVWDKVGGFDERFFLYFEDLDLSVRLAQHGIPVIVLAGFQVIHEGGQSTAGSRSVQRYHYIRSQILFARKWLRRDRAALVIARALIRGALGAIIGRRELRRVRRARFQAAWDEIAGHKYPTVS